MRIRKKARCEARQLFRLCLADGLLDEGRLRLVVQRVLDAGGRGGAQVLAQLLRLVKLDRAQHAARIESAVPLSADLQAGIQAGLARRYGPGLQVAFAQRAALIGGIRIQVGDDVYDGSVSAGLAALAKRF
jgi:F-type H+-transporting ATPase subunit delta